MLAPVPAFAPSAPEANRRSRHESPTTTNPRHGPLSARTGEVTPAASQGTSQTADFSVPSKRSQRPGPPDVLCLEATRSARATAGRPGFRPGSRRSRRAPPQAQRLAGRQEIREAAAPHWRPKLQPVDGQGYLIPGIHFTWCCGQEAIVTARSLPYRMRITSKDHVLGRWNMWVCGLLYKSVRAALEAFGVGGQGGL